MVTAELSNEEVEALATLPEYMSLSELLVTPFLDGNLRLRLRLTRMARKLATRYAGTVAWAQGIPG